MSKKLEYKSLLSILTLTNPDGCVAILEKYSNDNSRIRNIKDLQVRLARTYAVSSNKPEIEREFAALHPHKDFILKYNSPVEPEFKAVESPVVVETAAPIKEIQSNFCSCSNCSNKDRFSNIEGITPQGQTSDAISQNTIVVLSVVSIVAIVGMVLYLKK